MSESMYGFVSIFLIVLRIVITVYCVNKANQLNRSKWGWGLFGFFFPIIAVIWIQFMKPHIIWESNPDLAPKETIEANPQPQMVNYYSKELMFWFGLIFLTIGILFMIVKIFPEFSLKDYFWPIILIGVGIGLMIRRNKHK
ncbi:MAG: hypothetical protein H8D23_04960 [Candidatus Brocadiales bacterium]|nr:hypothetical protein [Candidatus Brocadiales bacterium]